MLNRTKEWIGENTKMLLLQKPLDKISVTEICIQTGIERSTFYYYFKDKYDLVAWMLFQKASDVDLFSIRSNAQFLESLKQNSAVFRQVYAKAFDDTLWNSITGYYIDKYIREAERILGVGELDPQMLFSIQLFCYGGVAMTKEWLFQGKISALDCSRMMLKSLPENLKSIFPLH